MHDKYRNENVPYDGFESCSFLYDTRARAVGSVIRVCVTPDMCLRAQLNGNGFGNTDDNFGRVWSVGSEVQHTFWSHTHTQPTHKQGIWAEGE